MPEVLVIIPARGGSRGIPRKNLQLLAGKPLIVHSIHQARESRAIHRVIVSTDDSEIASVAAAAGAEISLRPAELATDTAPTEAALLHVLDTLLKNENYQPDLVVFLQATSPLRQPNDLELAIQTLTSEQADSLFSARHVEGFVWRRSAEELAPLNYDPTARPFRQQLRERILEENGSFYLFKPAILRKFNSRLGGKVACHLMSPLDSYQVDDLEDLALLERIVALRTLS